MVKRIIFFALFVLLVACERESKQNNYWKNIDLCQELGFKRDTNLIKPNLIATYYHKEGFCSNIINLYNDSTFEREGGCEGNSRRTLGKWKINMNNLILKESTLNELNLVYDYSISGDTSNYLVISISNRFDKPLSQFALHAFNNSVKSPYNLHTDENGIIRLKKETYDSISIVAFKEIRNKIFTIKRENFPDTLSLKIYTDGINYYGWPKYTCSKKEYSYKIKKDKTTMDEYNFEMRKITNR